MSTHSQMPPKTLTHYLLFNLEETLKEKELKYETRLSQVVALFLGLGSGFQVATHGSSQHIIPVCKDFWVF